MFATDNKAICHRLWEAVDRKLPLHEGKRASEVVTDWFANTIYLENVVDDAVLEKVNLSFGTVYSCS